MPADDLGLGHVLGTATRISPPPAAHNRTSASQPRSRTRPIFAGHTALTGALSKWGGWGSNPRPADYESAALTG